MDLLGRISEEKQVILAMSTSIVPWLNGSHHCLHRHASSSSSSPPPPPPMG